MSLTQKGRYYAEYHDNAFLERLVIKDLDLAGFWPARGPQ